MHGVRLTECLSNRTTQALWFIQSVTNCFDWTTCSGLSLFNKMKPRWLPHCRAERSLLIKKEPPLIKRGLIILLSMDLLNDSKIGSMKGIEFILSPTLRFTPIECVFYLLLMDLKYFNIPKQKSRGKRCHISILPSFISGKDYYEKVAVTPHWRWWF